MKSKMLLSIISLTLAFALTACGGTSDASVAESANESATVNEVSNGERQFSIDIQDDNQGAVSVTVKPLNLNNPSETLDFEIEMNTHSVDLSTNLSETAILSTDTGLEIRAIAWDGVSGGHHVSGNLSFPSYFDGQSVLEGITQVTLTIHNVDVSERVFVWQLQAGG